MKFEPAYVKLHESDELKNRIKAAYGILERCTLCPRRCKVNRAKDERGWCRAGLLAKVSSFSPHFGEERCLVGVNGSGTIFFSECNLRCIYCQNYDISVLGEGEDVSLDELSKMMVALWKMGCHNINFVTPTHFVPQILAALPKAIDAGLNVPLVYNSGGYDSIEELRLLDGVADIYMPDLKYADSKTSEIFSHAKEYPQVAKAAIKEMHRQVGDLVLDERGIALRGLLVRHLVLPEGLAGTKAAMEFLADEISKDTYVNVMAQYRPCGEAYRHPPLDRPVTDKEYEEAINLALKAGLHRLDDKKVT